MKNQNFTSTIMVAKTPTEAFKTILNVRAWWSGLFAESFDGNSDKIGDEFSFRAGEGVHYSKQRLVELVPNQKVTWLVIESNLSFLEKTDEWNGTQICFEVSERANKTQIVFTHVGLQPEVECYEACAPAWTQYIQEQLKRVLTKADENA